MKCNNKTCPYYLAKSDGAGQCGRSTAHIRNTNCKDRFGPVEQSESEGSK